MNSMHIALLTFCIFAHSRGEDKKSKQRDVNDAAETVDYTLNKIPLYVIPNTPPIPEAKVPVAVIPGAYSPTYLNAGIKDAKQFKYGFYAPYKGSKATPIHEPTSEETSAAYGTQNVYQKTEYDPTYKLSAPAKDYQTNNAYVKYDNSAKSLLPKHQPIQNSNAYASLAPAYNSAGTEAGGVSSYVPAPKKFTTYDPENHVQIQYVIKYVPVPYTVQPTDQQYAQNPADVAYITPKPSSAYGKESFKKTAYVTNNNQNLHSLTPVTYPTSTEAYAEYAKYAESYAPGYDDANIQQTAFKYSQPSYYAKYVDKNAKKYVPTSYVLATIGKSAPTHYATSIKHESGSHDNYFSTKLANVPPAVDKYTGQEYKTSAVLEEVPKSYPETDYAYAIANSKYKHQATLPAATHFLAAYDYNIPDQYLQQQQPQQSQHQPQQLLYYKKDVSASVSTTPSYETSSEKL